MIDQARTVSTSAPACVCKVPPLRHTSVSCYITHVHVYGVTATSRTDAAGSQDETEGSTG